MRTRTPEMAESVGRRRNPNPLPLPLFFFFKELEHTNLFTETFYLGAALGPWAAFLAHYLGEPANKSMEMEQKSCNILIYTHPTESSLTVNFPPSSPAAVCASAARRS